MSSCVCKILFKSEQICSCCCKMLRGSLFRDTRYKYAQNVGLIKVWCWKKECTQPIKQDLLIRGYKWYTVGAQGKRRQYQQFWGPINKISYDNLTIMPKLRSTYDGRLIYKTCYNEWKAFHRQDSRAKS